MTKNINQEVWRLISQDFSIQKDLKRGLVNVRALAKHLIKEHALTASLDAVISAIRRCDLQDLPQIRENVDSLIRDMTVYTRDDVAIITLKAHKLPKMFYDRDISRIHANYRLIKSKLNAKICLNADDLDEVLAAFTKQDLVGDVKKDIAEIRIALPPGGESVSGILSRVLNEIALRKVSLAEIIVCYPEFLIYVDRKKLLEAHHAILAMHDEAKKKS